MGFPSSQLPPQAQTNANFINSADLLTEAGGCSLLFFHTCSIFLMDFIDGVVCAGVCPWPPCFQIHRELGGLGDRGCWCSQCPRSVGNTWTHNLKIVCVCYWMIFYKIGRYQLKSGFYTNMDNIETHFCRKGLGVYTIHFPVISSSTVFRTIKNSIVLVFVETIVS